MGVLFDGGSVSQVVDIVQGYDERGGEGLKGGLDIVKG